MALPGQRGATNSQNADEVAALHALIVHLKLTHPRMTWRQIGYATHYHWKYCQTVFYRERAKSSGAKLIEQHVVEVLEELDELADQFRPLVTGGVAAQQPPPKHVLDLQLKIIDRKARWSGASAWARRKALASKAATASGGTATPQPRSFSSSRVEARHRQVIELRLNNPHMTWKEIGLITSFHPNYCSLIFAKTKELAIRSEALEGCRQQILDELEAIGDKLRDALPSESAPNRFEPHKDHVNALLKILDRKVKLLGLDLVVPVEDEVTSTPESETPPERQSDGPWYWLTASQLFHAGLLDVEDFDGQAAFVITEKGRAAGFDFSPGWTERWRDVYVGYDRHWELGEKYRAKNEKKMRLREVYGKDLEPGPGERETVFGAEAGAPEPDSAEVVSTVELQPSQQRSCPDWVYEHVARRDGSKGGQ